ncbi:MAG: hypothetical protein PHO02_06475 [Candidatus Nanoarchaeia archaeon]|nr:hypothetical protein [Candidatus Nanoarchaeia archaeon]
MLRCKHCNQDFEIDSWSSWGKKPRDILKDNCPYCGKKLKFDRAELVAVKRKYGAKSILLGVGLIMIVIGIISAIIDSKFSLSFIVGGFCFVIGLQYSIAYYAISEKIKISGLRED